MIGMMKKNLIELNESNSKTYTITCKKGYVGDFAKEYWTEEDYKKHNDFVQQCKEDGTLGEEFEVKMTILYNPILDNSNILQKGTSSLQFTIIDFSNGK